MKTKFFTFFSLLLPALIILGLAINTGNYGSEKAQINIDKNTVETSKVEENEVVETVDTNIDNRIVVLEKFFDTYNSPLKGHAKTFVDTAEKYNIDYKLLPAISCIESTCGKFIIPDSYNPFGWGVTSKGHIAFSSFDEAIQKVGEGLNKGYFSKGLDTISEIAPVYTPPNSQHWANGVNYFIYKMNEIEELHKQEELKNKVLTYL